MKAKEATLKRGHSLRVQWGAATARVDAQPDSRAIAVDHIVCNQDIVHKVRLLRSHCCFYAKSFTGVLTY